MSVERARHGAAHGSPAGPTQAATFPAVPAWVGAVILIAGALALSYGAYHPLSLSAVTLATALVLVSLLRRRAGPEARGTDRWTVGLLAAGIVGSLAHDALFLPGITVDPSRLGAFRPTLGAIVVLLATHLWKSPPAVVTRLRFPLVVASWMVLAATVLHAAPQPGIDVWLLQQGGALALLEGWNPYAFVFRNPYGPGTAVIARELLTPDGVAKSGQSPHPNQSVAAGMPRMLR